jgi:hypothetical protein
MVLAVGEDLPRVQVASGEVHPHQVPVPGAAAVVVWLQPHPVVAVVEVVLAEQALHPMQVAQEDPAQS